MRPNVEKFGKLIEDVTTDPATKRTVESHARAFDASNDPQYADDFTTLSTFLPGEKIHRWNGMMETLDEIIANSKLKRWMYRFNGSCNGGVCVGWNAQNVMTNVTALIDKEYGTNYQERLRKWIIYSQEKGLVVAGALTDAKGDRSMRPSQQSNPDSNVHIKEVRPDGIVISGYKAMICGVAASNEIFILPGGGYREEDQDYAVTCVVPRDIEGLTIVETRRPSDSRELENGWDIPDTGITQAYLLFQDCFVPNERVFMCKEFKYSGKIIEYFTANYRACIGACVAGQGDVMIGAGALMARVNGLAPVPLQARWSKWPSTTRPPMRWGSGPWLLARKAPVAHGCRTRSLLMPTKSMLQPCPTRPSEFVRTSAEASSRRAASRPVRISKTRFMAQQFRKPLRQATNSALNHVRGLPDSPNG